MIRAITITALTVALLASTGLNYALYYGVFDKSVLTNQQVASVGSLVEYEGR